MTPAPNRPRFRWSLRTMFVVVMVIGTLLGWGLAHWKWIRDRRDARVWLRAHHGLAFDAGLGFVMTRIDGSVMESRDGISTTDGRSLSDLPQAPRSLRLLGENSVYFIFLAGIAGEGEPPIDFQERDAKLPELQSLFPETELIVYPPGSYRAGPGPLRHLDPPSTD